MNFIIKNYINKIKEEDIIKFSKENDLFLSLNEASYLYSIVKNNLDDILNGEIDNTLENLKSKFGDDKTQKIKELYLTYLEKYKDYL